MDFFATIRGVSKADRRTRSASLLEGMGLAEFTKRQAQHLSGGMKQKLMLATTLMHEPDLLLLDEPTTGVDPVSRREFWRILAGLHRAGKTVLVATPYMDEAERCTQIAFLDNGRIKQFGTPDEIKARVPGRLVEVSATPPRAALTAIATVNAKYGIQKIRVADTLDALTVEYDATRLCPAEVEAALAAAGVDGARTREVAPDMETVFAYLAGTEVAV